MAQNCRRWPRPLATVGRARYRPHETVETLETPSDGPCGPRQPQRLRAEQPPPPPPSASLLRSRACSPPPRRCWTARGPAHRASHPALVKGRTRRARPRATLTSSGILGAIAQMDPWPLRAARPMQALVTRAQIQLRVLFSGTLVLLPCRAHSTICFCPAHPNALLRGRTVGSGLLPLPGRLPSRPNASCSTCTSDSAQRTLALPASRRSSLGPAQRFPTSASSTTAHVHASRAAPSPATSLNHAPTLAIH
jgi:hypothetical protein